MKSVIENAKSYSSIQTPVIIIGDKGTGKDTLANDMYHYSHYNKSFRNDLQNL